MTKRESGGRMKANRKSYCVGAWRHAALIAWHGGGGICMAAASLAPRHHSWQLLAAAKASASLSLLPALQQLRAVFIGGAAASPALS